MASITPASFVTLLPDRIGDDKVISMRDVLLSMTCTEHSAFAAEMEQSEFSDSWKRLNEDFAAVATAEGAWPEPTPDQLLEEIDVRVKDLVSVVSLTNGRLLLRMSTRLATLLTEPTKLMTPSEFLFYHGHPIQKYVQELINPRIKRLKRASEVLTALAPTTFVVQYVDGNTVDAVVGSVTLCARSADQIAEWAKRRHVRITDVTPANVEEPA